METQELQSFLLQNESPTLEFKERWYKLEQTEPQKTRERELGELIKDVLSLANGNADVVGETAYLIIGAADKLGPNGTRPLYDVTDHVRPAKELLQLINPYCVPPLSSLYIESHIITGCKLHVITIPPSPHVHETLKSLKTPKHDYPEHIVFVRHGEHVRNASTRERNTLLQIKQVRFQEAKNPSPIGLGAFIAAVVVGSVVYSDWERVTGRKDGKLFGGLIGAGMGGFLGGMLADVIVFAKELRADWPQMSNVQRITSLAIAPLSIIATAMIRNVIKHRRSTQPPFNTPPDPQSETIVQSK